MKCVLNVLICLYGLVSILFPRGIDPHHTGASLDIFFNGWGEGVRAGPNYHNLSEGFPTTESGIHSTSSKYFRIGGGG